MIVKTHQTNHFVLFLPQPSSIDVANHEHQVICKTGGINNPINNGSLPLFHRSCLQRDRGCSPCRGCAPVQRRNGFSSLRDPHRRSQRHQIKELDHIRVSQAHAAVAHGSADAGFVVGAVDVDVALKGIGIVRLGAA